MKKRIALLLSFVLVLSLALCACGGSKKETPTTIVGTWKTDIDMTDMLNAEMEAAGMGEFIKLDSFELVLLMTFNEDGTGSMTVDEKALEKSMEDLADSMSKGMEDYFASMGLNLDELLAAEGMSMDDFVDEMMAEFSTEDMTAEFTTEFSYKTDGDKLFLSDDLDAEFDEEEYNTYKLKGDTLTLEAGTEELDEDLAFLFPMTLKRAK